MIEEIDKTIPVGSEITAENLADLTYMDQTICESMRYGSGVRIVQTSILIGQEVQLCSCCPIRMSCQTNNNALIG